jgi:type II secretion system protein N
VNIPNIKLKTWQRRTLYGLFAAFAFLFALRQTTPIEAVKERLVMEAAAQGWQLSIADARAAGFVGIGMNGVTLQLADGTRIPVERLDATLRLLPLVLGRRGVSFDAALYDGHVKGFAEDGRGAQRIVATVAGVDLSRATALRKSIGVDLGGTVSGDVDLVLDTLAPPKSTGHVDLAVDKAAVNGGEMPIPGMAGALTLPKLALGQVTAKAVVKDGKLTFDKLEAKSDDVEATGDGLYLVMQPRLAFAPIFGKAKVKIRDGFWLKSGAAGFKGVVEMALAQARGRDGAYGFQIFGTLTNPQARMAANP